MFSKGKSTFLISVCTILIILTFGACSNKNDNVAVYVYSFDDTKREAPLATITWDDKDQLSIINSMINDMYETAGEATEEVQMSYTIVLINSNVENDNFEIGLDGQTIYGRGEIQGTSINNSYATSITSDDFLSLLKSK